MIIPKRVSYTPPNTLVCENYTFVIINCQCFRPLIYIKKARFIALQSHLWRALKYEISRLFCSWMCLVVNVLNMVLRGRQIHLRCHDVFMPHELL